MKERPILFSAPMVRAILDGRKTQTRRALKVQPTSTPVVYQASLTRSGSKPVIAAAWNSEQDDCCLCPYGVPGDRLWVREAFVVADRPENMTVYSANYTDDNRPLIRWKPSIHMPRARSRITLEVTNVAVEKLQTIAVEEAEMEGCKAPIELVMQMGCRASPSLFRELWESINGAGSWDANPWVWVITFRRVE